MKILFVHTHYRYRGGEDQAFENDVQLMKKSGHQVDMVIFNNSKYSFIKLLSLPFNIFSFKAINQKIKSYKPDIVHIHNFHFAGSAAILYACKLNKVPSIVTLHNFRMICPSATLYFDKRLYFSSLNAKFPWRSVFKAVYKNSVLITFWLAFSNWLNRKVKIFGSVNTYIALNEYAKQLHFGMYPNTFKNISVCPNFINDPGTIVSARNNSLLYVGRLSEEKGIDILLKVHEILRFHLIIIGDGPLSDLVKQHEKQFTDTTYLGFKSKEEIFENLQNCSALILPSVCMEMNPVTMVEAMACGTPILASKLDTLKDYIIDGYNGYTFTANCELSMKDTILKFLQNTLSTNILLSKNARTTYIKQFTEQKHLASLVTIYNSATANEKY